MKTARVRRFARNLMLPLAALLLASACAGDDGLQLGHVTRLGVSGNGVSLNGVSLNGVSLNGVSLNGVTLGAISFSGATLGGAGLTGVGLNGSQLSALNPAGNPVSGSGLVGAELSGELTDGQTLPVRVDAIRQGTSSHADVFFYQLSFYADGGWHPLCGNDDAGLVIEGVLIPGTWSFEFGVPGGGGHIDTPNAFTVGCMGKSIAKCVLMGFKPWATGPSTGASLANHHEACVRMLRADYCGTGVSHTYNGTPINLHDSEGIQVDTEDWGHEAEWDQDGARCVSESSVRYLTSGEYPACVSERIRSDCGANPEFGQGSLLVSECAWCDGSGQAPTH